MTEARRAREGADALFQALWEDYVRITPDAARIQAFLRDRGEQVVNDHVAFRTFGLDPIRITAIARPFLDLGYRYADETLRFQDKHLVARYLLPPGPDQPRVFVSELVVSELPAEAAGIVRDLVSAVDRRQVESPGFLPAADPWPRVAEAAYDRLAAASEYAGWVAAFGIRANHFTVLVNRLRTFSGIGELVQALKGAGFRISAAGGEIKGGPEVLLEQASTQANEVEWPFAGRVWRRIPSCYYEFARRWPDPRTGHLYEGFVPASANRLFEATDRGA